MKRVIMAGYETILPDHRADWDGWAEWERVRFASMERNLRPGDVLFDVGAEYGDMSAIYARMAGGQIGLCLFESAPEVWTNIRQIWQAAGLAPPLACFVGLVGEVTAAAGVRQDFDATVRDGWPECAWVEKIWPDRTFRYLHYDSHLATTQQTRLDDWTERTGIQPTALTIDVEGAELKVLRGAWGVLERSHPMVFCSIHPDVLASDYHATRDEILGYMRGLGYEATHLGTDHEEHWAFSTAERPLL
jgi:FkbM family methyltransferase